MSIVSQRVESLGAALELPAGPPAVEQIRRVVTVFRELRDGVTEDGRTKLKTPSGTLSTAEAISVMTNGWSLAAHFGDGEVSASDVAGGIVGAVVQDPVQDRAVLREYLEIVVKDRNELARPVPGDQRAAVSVAVFGIRHHGPGSARQPDPRARASCGPTAC